MVCAKCQKLSKGTTLATPAVKKKSELYYGSPATTSSTASGAKSTTLGHNGVSKVRLNLLRPLPPSCSPLLPIAEGPVADGPPLVTRSLQSKLLSKSAKNPYAQYSRLVCPGQAHAWPLLPPLKSSPVEIDTSVDG